MKLPSKASTNLGASHFVVAIGSSRRGGTSEGDLKKGWFQESNEFKALTDGLLRIRYLFGFSVDSLVSGAIGPDAKRDTAEAVEAYIKESVPSD